MSQTLGQTTPGRDLKKRFLYLGLAMLSGLFLVAVQLYRLQIAQSEE
jgi:penicillin-binding protein 2